MHSKLPSIPIVAPLNPLCPLSRVRRSARGSDRHLGLRRFRAKIVQHLFSTYGASTPGVPFLCLAAV